MWTELAARTPLSSLSPEAKQVFEYAFGEMVNNAIDHSDAQTVSFGFAVEGQRLAFEVLDDGEGIFRHVMRECGLESPLVALEELSKGKLTTMPSRHSGEGLFFTSRVADYLEVESGELKWIVDNARGDVAVGVGHRPKGTRVRFEADPARTRPLAEVFGEYTRDLKFTKSRTHVKLFQHGATFLSRSEGRRVVNGLEKFEEVLLDFAGVQAVGQGFVDEVFRVWARAHPAVRLEPVNMASPVEFMVRRGLAVARDLP